MARLTYDEVGATRDGALPEGYRHLRYRVRLDGCELERAAEAVLTWRLHRATGVRVEASGPRAEPGVRVTLSLGIGRLRVSAPCEVIWAVAERDRAGFGYGTLPGHPERGEEAFVVERTGSSQGGGVWFAVTAFSRHAAWYARAAGPLTVVAQRAYARRLGSVLRRLCTRP